MKKWLENFARIVSASVLLASSLMPLTASAFSGSGLGTLGNPYQITDCSSWLEMASDLSAYYVLENNIDCSSTSYTPIGASGNEFTGNLDGNGYVISGVTVDGSDRAGLFGYTIGATIQNLRIENSNFTNSTAFTGALVGNADGGTFSNITVSGTTVESVQIGAVTGGLIGYTQNGATLITSSNFTNGTIASNQGYTGGLVGLVVNDLTISNSYAKGITINPTTGAYVGGLVGGMNSGSPVISKSYAQGTISSIDTYYGGLVGGLFTGTVQDSFAAIDMTADAGTYSGGAFGVGDGTATNVYFDATLAGRVDCSGSGAASCMAVNVGNAAPNYFKGNNSNAPMDTWTVDSPWNLHKTNAYPTFSIGQAACDDPTPQPATAIHFACEWQRLSYHKYSGVLVSQSIKYRIHGSSDSWVDQSWASDSLNIVICGLQPSTQYDIKPHVNWAVGSSDWENNTASFVTSGSSGVDTDGDGIKDSTELCGPHSGDNNNDGTLDSQQATVVSFVNPVTGKYTTITTDTCDLSNVSGKNSSTLGEDSSYNYPMGLIDFTAHCSVGHTATITQYFYNPPAGNFVLRKYSNGGYQTVSGATLSRQVIGGQQVLVATYHVTDGGSLDADGVANGVIVDPVGPALLSIGAPNTGVGRQDASIYPLLTSVLLFAAAALVAGFQRIFRTQS